MPSGQPTSSWSATAFSRVFGESAARLPAGLPYRTIFLLPTATEDRHMPGDRCKGEADMEQITSVFAVSIAREQCATHDAELSSHERATVGYSLEDISSHALLSGIAAGHVASARAVR